MKGWITTIRNAGFGALACVTSGAIADNASVLPQGVSRAYWDFYNFLPTTDRYNGDGDREPLTFPFDNAALDSNAFNILPPGQSLGDVMVGFEFDIDILDLGYAYGLTDDLTLGFHVPYFWIRNDVSTALDTSGATLGIIPGTDTIAPFAFGAVPVSEADVQNLIVDTYGIEPVDDWEREGIGDIELGGKYRFFRTRHDALAMSAGLRFPTGYEDDPDKLDDLAWSYGNRAVLLRLHYDYLLSSLWRDSPSGLEAVTPAAGDLIGNVTLRWDLMLPDERTMRVGDTPLQTFNNNRERVDRELGDLYNLEFTLKYQASDRLSMYTNYLYAWKSKDDIDGDMGFNYSSLEQDTDSKQQIIVVGLSYSTLVDYQPGQSIPPLEYSLAYRERFDGEGPQPGQANSILYTRYWTVGMKVLF